MNYDTMTQLFNVFCKTMPSRQHFESAIHYLLSRDWQHVGQTSESSATKGYTDFGLAFCKKHTRDESYFWLNWKTIDHLPE
jgi:hypothetical protein